MSVSVKNGKRCIVSNGLPDHATGKFPNSGNPNGIEKQNVNVCLAANPKRNSRPTAKKGAIGIGINGVQFRPGTAGYYDGTVARKNSRNPASGWKLEGLNPGNILGMDQNNAHVGPNGLYHYHGVSKALVKSSRKGLIGYAADGFEIRYDAKQTSSFKLKSGARPSSNGQPGGTYDGTYEQDFAYAKGSGSLDACNGKMINGKYIYFATETYPFLPRCLWGSVSKDLEGPAHGREAGSGQRRNGQNSQRRNRRNRQDGQRRGPPKAAIQACASKREDASCRFKGRRGNRMLRGSCRVVRNGDKACVPRRRG